MPTIFKNTERSRAEFYKQEGGLPKSQGGRGVFTCLITFYHPAGTLRFINNTESITSRGNLYNAVAVTIALPAEDGKREPYATIEIDNITTDLVDELRAISEPMDAELEMVFTEYPDIVEYSLTGLSVGSANIAAERVTLKLMYQDILNQIFPGHTYNPQEFAGIF